MGGMSADCGQRLESVSFGNGDRPWVILRFFSLREAVMAKRYFDVRCGYEGKASYVRDYADRELRNLRWDRFRCVGEMRRVRGGSYGDDGIALVNGAAEEMANGEWCC